MKIYLLMETTSNPYDDPDSYIIKAFANEADANKAAEEANERKYGDKKGGKHRYGYDIGFWVNQVEFIQ